MDMEKISLNEARAWDNQDPLRLCRDAFALPEGVIYLDGNSLGPLSRAAQAQVAHTVEAEWGAGLIRSWDDAGWMQAPGRVGDMIARLVGARPGEVTVADSTSVNLFKIAAAAVALRPGRNVLLMESGNFPTDRHVLDGLARLIPGLRVVAAPADELPGLLGPQIAALLLCHVDYRSGARHDMPQWVAATHAVGALSLWDLSHSVGAVAVDLGASGADMAVGCGYKFLNGGPGAPAFIYVEQGLQAEARSPVQGWIGHAAPFGFDDIYEPAPGITRFLSGTPGVLGLVALQAGIEVFLQANPRHLWEKSARMFDLFAAMASDRLTCITPKAPESRGSHIAFTCQQAQLVMGALIARGVIGDFRPPNILRFGLTPLYTSYQDIWQAAAALNQRL
jgi:kynureninase